MNYISEIDLKEKCWWCGKKIRGFSVVLGRDLSSKYNHFCNDECLNNFNLEVRKEEWLW